MIDPWLGLLLLKMAVAAAIVVSCSLLAERSGPLLAAMIATLPISAGPVLAFLALDHDAAFISASALGSMNSNLGNACLSLVYVLLAQRFGTVVSLGAGLVTWVAAIVVLRELALPFPAILALTIIIFPALHGIFRPYLAARPAKPPGRLWYVLPLRATTVATLTGVVTTLSATVGPTWSGVLAAVPLVLSSLIAILQPRIGGPASAAVIANSALGLLGFGLGLATVHATAPTIGSWAALGLGLLVCIVWNLGLMALARRRATP
ncbi:hypothetical protein QO058_29085 [Bosea vestrisii]|uniref:hypothetical protein n=1 Tax=Bosea vestrisii TaxID=151416 RepID=UPI0024DF56C9|nr:hypothetical protein [Bosea vestrisii]WID96710.1 hypothetical protein QO058_29085 [Bosea vestrisii]